MVREDCDTGVMMEVAGVGVEVVGTTCTVPSRRSLTNVRVTRSSPMYDVYVCFRDTRLNCRVST